MCEKTNNINYQKPIKLTWARVSCKFMENDNE